MTDVAAGQHRAVVAERHGRSAPAVLQLFGIRVRTDELDFQLPPELIAQAPAGDRDASRLLHYRRSDRLVEHRRFRELPELLRAGDLLVFNDAQVVPARFVLRKQTGGRVEGLFLAEPVRGRWDVLLKNLGKAWSDAELHFESAPELRARVLGRGEGGQYQIAVESDEPAEAILSRVGRMPLPPYIRREKVRDDLDDADRQRYQTVYARAPGSVAAPTAGLHFTPGLLEALEKKGIERTFVTLHVGLGTFKPVTSASLEEHAMHAEAYSIDEAAAERLNQAKRQGRRIIAVGTTAARVLESQPEDAPFEARRAETRIFIYPPYRWRHVEGLITNFHLPRSTLIALVAAMVGLEEQRRLYSIAIAERYRFFSYGDAMFIE